MATQPDKSQILFRELASDYQTFRPEALNTVACPLCLTEYGLADIDSLSREHIVPSALGGRAETLTCRRKCNNAHGARLDSHLVKAMKAMDGIDGLEPIATTLGSARGKIVAELRFGDGTPKDPNKFRIVGKASNRAAVKELGKDINTRRKLDVKMSLQFIPERYFRAAFRAAFLSVFKAEGYRYALSEGAVQVRNMLNANVPVLEQVIMQAFPERAPENPFVVMPITFNDVGECYVVLLRLKTKRIRYITVFLPGKSGCDWPALEALYEHAPRLRLETTPHGWDSKLYIRLGYDPLYQIRKGLEERLPVRGTPMPQD